MQTIATLATRLDMSAEKALELLRYMQFDVGNVDSEISDEAVDLLIDVDEDPSKAERVRDSRLKDIEKAEAAKKRKAAAAKRLAKPKKKEEPVTAEAETPAVETVEGEPAPSVVTAEGGPTLPQAAPVEIHEKPYAEILPELTEADKEPEAQRIVIGSAIDHEATHRVEIVRADGSRIEAPEAEIAEPAGEATEEEEEETGLLAEAQRRQEEEERRRTKTGRPLPQPDPAVVAEVIRRAAERTQKAKREQRGVKVQKLQKQQRSDRSPGEPGGEVETTTVRRSSNTGKTARKRQKKVEKVRAMEAMRRDAMQAVREYESGGIPGAPKKRKRRRSAEDALDAEGMQEGPDILEVQDKMTVEQFAEAMEIGVNDIILDLMDHNVLASKNQPLTFDLMKRVAEARGFEVRAVIPEEAEALAEVPDDPRDLVPRAPVVTVMGHVDHGKTTLLDRVRTANVAATEAGGITQHIAAYDVAMPNGGRVVFLDTPGHEAFTQMRARGAKATDVVVLVVAADDGVMPQTIEAIDHAKAAEVPIVIAINKCDRPDAQPDRIRQELTRFDLVDEQWGGKTIMKNISAKTGEGVTELMEMLALETDLLELKANPKKRARGVVIESEISRGFGPVAWVLIQDGTLRAGDVFLAGESFGRVRTMLNARGESFEEAGPATPVLVTGFSIPPDAGTEFVAIEDERQARSIAEQRNELSRQRQGAVTRHITLEDFHERLLAGEKRSLNVVLKADVQGSVDVLESSLAKIGNEDVSVSLVHAGVGGINESDVLLASASDAVVIGFHVTANARVKKFAEREGVDVRTYRIIYEAIADVRAALEGMLAPERRETVVGHVEIRAVFRSSAFGNIAGCYVLDGEISRSSQVRLLRDDVIVYEGRVASLRREKDDARSVSAGLECGVKLENFDDIKAGDVIETYQVDSVAKVLA